MDQVFSQSPGAIRMRRLRERRRNGWIRIAPTEISTLDVIGDRPVNALYRGDGFAGYAADAA